jgi:hypothetical protein
LFGRLATAEIDMATKKMRCRFGTQKRTVSSAEGGFDSRRRKRGNTAAFHYVNQPGGETMNRVLPCVALAIFLAAAYYAASATEVGDQKGTPTDVEKDLQKKLAEHTPRIVAAGTATWQLGQAQNNATSVRVQLKDEIASKLGDDYIVILTGRYSGYPFYVPYWKKARDGFDITLVDPTLAPNGSVSYIINVNRNFPVDWVVVKK